MVYSDHGKRRINRQKLAVELLEQRQLLAIVGPTATGQVIDNPLDGQADSVVENWAAAYKVSGSREARAFAEHDIQTLISRPSLAVLEFNLNVPQALEGQRELRLDFYSGDGQVTLGDFEVTSIASRTVSYWSAELLRNYQLDVTSTVQQLFDSGATHFGVRLSSPIDLTETRFVGSSLALDELPPQDGIRGYEMVPNAILADGSDAFRVQVDVGGDVKRVTVDAYTHWLVDRVDDLVVLRDDGLEGDLVAGDFVYTSPEFRWPADRPLPAAFYENSLDSPAGVSVATLGAIEITELDDSASEFLVTPEVGLLHSDFPLVSVQSLAADAQASDHFVNIRTDISTIQSSLRQSRTENNRLMNRFYEVMSDDFDFVFLTSTEKIEAATRTDSRNFISGTNLKVQVDYTGNGLSLFDSSGSYGSDGRLQGLLTLDAFNRGLAGSNATHELVHHWSAYLDPSLGISSGSHYRPNSSVGSLIGGQQWIDNGDGSYTLNPNEGRGRASKASPLDRYFMGLIDSADVPPLRVYNTLADPPISLYGNPIVPAEEIISETTIDDIINIHGARTPGPAESQKDFNLAFLGESSHRLLNQVEMTFYEAFAAHYTSDVPQWRDDPVMDHGWGSVTRFFGDDVSWNSTLPGRQAIQNQSPTGQAATFYVSEDVPPYYVNGGQSVVGTVDASDPDGHSLAYVISSGNEARDFVIDPQTGDIRVNSYLDRAVTEVYDLVVTVGDVTTLNQIVEIPITIVVTGDNREPLISDQAFTMEENPEQGQLIGQVVASDPDIGQTLQYQITGGSESGGYAIDANTGELSVADPSTFDYESTPIQYVTVTVTDNGDPSLQASATITVTLTNVVGSPAAALKPGSSTNVLDTKADSTFEIALLSSAEFDAITQIDVDSLRFGLSGTEDSLKRHKRTGAPRYELRDADGDGTIDVVAVFELNKTGLSVGDTEGLLTGSLINGESIQFALALEVRSGGGGGKGGGGNGGGGKGGGKGKKL